MAKLKRFKLTIPHCQELEPGSMLLTAESLGNASYRFLKTLDLSVEEISETEFFDSGGKDE